jgi:murein DD-endopeptidase MepM/ murein hydrolase activator NlpD
MGQHCKFQISSLILRSTLLCLLSAAYLSMSIEGRALSNSSNSVSHKMKTAKRLQMREIIELRNTQKKLEQSLLEVEREYPALNNAADKARLALSSRIVLIQGLVERQAFARPSGDAGMESVEVLLRLQHYLLKRDVEALDHKKSLMQRLYQMRAELKESQTQAAERLSQVQSSLNSLQTLEQIENTLVQANRSHDRAQLQELSKRKEDLLSAVRKVDSLRPSANDKRLSWPIPGRVLSQFGRSYNAKNNLLTFEKGLLLEPTGSKSVKAVDSGKVAFAGQLKNYGNVIIIEHRSGMFSLYGQLQELKVVLHDVVQTQDVLGTVGAQPLYFELRRQNVALDPLVWLQETTANDIATKSKQRSS